MHAHLLNTVTCIGCDLFQNSCCLSLCIRTGSGHDLGLIIGVSVGGGCAAIVAFVAVLSLSCWWRLWLKLRHKRNYCLLVDEDGSSYYGSASQSLTASVAYPNPSSSNEGLNIIQLLLISCMAVIFSLKGQSLQSAHGCLMLLYCGFGYICASLQILLLNVNKLALLY